MLFNSEPAFIKRAKELGEQPPKGTPYSVALPGTEQPGRSPVYRYYKSQKELLKTLDPEVCTGHDMFESAVKRNPKAPCLGWRAYNAATKSFSPYQWLDYQTVQQRKTNLGSGLFELHSQLGVTGRQYGVGLWCQNRPEWQITDLACMSQSLFSVSIYDVLGPESTEYIINHAELRCVVASLPHIPTLLKLKPNLPELKCIISLDPLDGGEQAGHSKRDLLRSIAGGLGITIYTLEEVEELGAAANHPCTPPSASDIITINYTSGTTGPPKGVVLTHENAVASSSGAMLSSTQTADDVSISYLPLAHIYARCLEHVALWAGSKIGYFHGNVVELVDDLKLLRPTSFASVPRLYNRFGGVIRASTVEQPGFKGALSRHIVSTKLANLTKVGPEAATNKHMLYDRIWGKKVAAAMGLDRVRSMVSGSAPLDPNLHQFLRVVFGNTFVQGYGLTESYAATLAQAPEDFSSGNCGRIGPGLEACLESVPDMEYTVDDKPCPRGELLLRGHTIFREYHKNPEETAKAKTEDGWFRTGDICTIDAQGRFLIIDRRKNVLKLAQGEYVSPERIEGAYLEAISYLAQAFVHGDSLRTSLVAIFGVQPDIFAAFASKVLKRAIGPMDLEAIKEAASDDRVRRAVLADLNRVATKKKFTGYERVKNVALFVEPFSIDNDTLTPTLKLKRPQAAKKYRQLLDDLYAQADAEAAAPKAKL